MHDIKEVVIYLFEVPVKLPQCCFAQGHSFSSIILRQERKLECHHHVYPVCLCDKGSSCPLRL